MKTIHHFKGSFTIPEEYNELTKRQAKRLIKLLHAETDMDKAEIKALSILANCYLSKEVGDRCREFVQWVFTENGPTSQLLPYYRHFLNKRYYGPAGEFDNIIMREFHLTELAYKQLVDGDGSQLDMLVAILYRPAKPGYNFSLNPDGDPRQPLNHNLLPYHISRVKRWPLNIKRLIFTWYDACRQQVIDHNDDIFKEQNKDGFVSRFETGLYGMMRSLAGEKLGSVRDVEEMPLLQAILELNLIKEEERFYQQQLENQKP
jgi:hypothetical protein